MVRVLILGAALAAGSAAAAQEDPEMVVQRCVWSCLANSAGADDPAYQECVDRICTPMMDALQAGAAPAQSEPEGSAPVTSLRPPPRPVRPGEAEAEAAAVAEPEPEPEAPSAAGPPAAPEPAPEPPVAEAPAPDAPAPPPEGWTFGPIEGGTGFFARVADPATGVQVDWLCAKGQPTRLAVSPFPGGGTLGIDVGGRVETFPVTVEDGVGYAEAGIVSPLFLHMASGPSFALTDGEGAVLGRFPFEGAAAAIGQAEGRCRI